MPTIDLTDEELAAIAAALRRVIMEDRYPRAPRLRPLRAALAKLDPAAVPRPQPEPQPLPKAHPRHPATLKVPSLRGLKRFCRSGRANVVVASAPSTLSPQCKPYGASSSRGAVSYAGRRPHALADKSVHGSDS